LQWFLTVCFVSRRIHVAHLDNVFGDGDLGLLHLCIVGSVEDSTLELARDWDAVERKGALL
jgi:hypothetical protein